MGAKALWRFAYDRLAPGEATYTAELIVSHIKQLREVFSDGMDVVYAPRLALRFDSPRNWCVRM